MAQPPTFFDPHIHLWDPPNDPRQVRALVRALGFSPGLVDAVAKLLFPRRTLAFFGTPAHATRRYLLPEYKRDRAMELCDGVVHVEAGWDEKGPLGPAGETRFLEAMQADGGARIDAIVAHADLSQGQSVGALLSAHKQASERVRSVRHSLAWHPNKGVLDFAEREQLMGDPTWRAGFEQLAEHDLSFDAWCYADQLDELNRLASDYPQQPIVLCHLGTPVAAGGPFQGLGATAGERERIVGTWRERMAELAQRPNVSVKLSGLGMPVCGFGYDYLNPPSAAQVCDDFAPFVQFAVSQFTPERCMFASNFPVDKASMSLDVLCEAFRQIASGYKEADQQRLFGETARAFYRVEQASAATTASTATSG